ncbi:hypothetical protein CK203_099756 [Vitis vinifera]|uniref:Uncharacterized protein n=1 Tax=Vitis vinifera TaxID=29760 RepID=A0A438CYU3_VITVI|nr:hypothetical protein CK203_099756 [Vitis vinifera]
MGHPTEALVEAALRVLNTADPFDKARLGDEVATKWLQGSSLCHTTPSLHLPVPDRPARLSNVKLVPPGLMPSWEELAAYRVGRPLCIVLSTLKAGPLTCPGVNGVWLMKDVLKKCLKEPFSEEQVHAVLFRLKSSKGDVISKTLKKLVLMLIEVLGRPPFSIPTALGEEGCSFEEGKGGRCMVWVCGKQYEDGGGCFTLEPDYSVGGLLRRLQEKGGLREDKDWFGRVLRLGNSLLNLSILLWRLELEMFSPKGSLCSWAHPRSNFCGIPKLVVEEIQPAYPYQMIESFNPIMSKPILPNKVSNLVTVNQGVIAGSPSGIFQEEEQMLHRYVRPVGTGLED